MKKLLISTAGLLLFFACTSTPPPPPPEYRIEGSGDPDILIVENASLNGKSNNFPQGAIYLVLRNNTDKLIRSGSFGDLASFSMSLGMFISSNGSQSRIAVKDSPNATEVYLNILIKPGETVERYFYPLSDISIGDKQFSLILNFQTYEMPTEEPLKDLSEFPPEERQKEFMRRFMAAPTQPITNNYSIRLDFTQVEQ